MCDLNVKGEVTKTDCFVVLSTPALISSSFINLKLGMLKGEKKKKKESYRKRQ